MYCKYLLPIVTLLFICSYTVSTAQLATYTGSSGTSTAMTSASNTSIVTGGLQKTGFGSSSACGSGGLSGLTGTNQTTYATTNPHIYFQVLPNAGYGLSATGFSVGTRESSTGAAKAVLAYSLDGGTTWTASGTQSVTTGASCGSTNASNTYSWPTGGSAFGTSGTLTATSSTNGIIFAIFPFGASSSSGTYQLNTLSIAGSANCLTPSSTPTLSQTSTCTGSTITLATSDASWCSYKLYNGSTLEQTVVGNSGTVTFTVTPTVGTYSVQAVNTATGCSSSITNLTSTVAKSTSVPVIVTNPLSSAICAAANTTFNTVVTGATSYIWQKGGTNLTGTSDGGIYGSSYLTPSLTVTSPTTGVNGASYQLVATNACGNATSTAAILTVNACGGNTITTTASAYGSPYCNANSNSVSVAFTTTGGPYTTFTVQLSDQTGSFSSPTTIGTGSSSPITATLPSGITGGSGYRIRVISSSPAVTGGDNGADLTVSTPSVGGAVSSNQTVCSGGAAASFSLSGNTGSVLYWQSATNDTFSSPTTISGTAGLSTLSSAIIGTP